MKHCPYCGAKYSDDVIECPIDQNPLEGASVSLSPKEKVKKIIYDIPLLTAEKKQNDWVTILTMNNEIEKGIIIGCLQASGIEVKQDIPRTTVWLRTIVTNEIQVRPKDYDDAKELLNAD